VARSVAELLPKPFDDLGVDDVAAIIAAIGEERETLFFERKAIVSGNALAKACAAFANTYGGLLVAGVADADDALVGMEALPAAEPQLWVKDTLRNLVLPMPPFRARWLETTDGHGLLLVLVEESSVTPHIIARTGAIYVRSPGSSDPVPLADQRTLFELTARGEAAAERARRAISAAQHLRLETEIEPIETLVLAATGVPSQYEPALFDRTSEELLSQSAWGQVAPQTSDYRRSVWRQNYVGVERYQQSNFYPIHGNHVSAVIATRDGAVALYRGQHFPDGREPDRTEHLTEVQQRTWFERSLEAARHLLLELGCHGDATLLYRLQAQGRGLWFESRENVGARDLPGDLKVELSTTLEAEPVTDRVFDEVARALGLGPPAQRPQ
jgi:hypothetical protein